MPTAKPTVHEIALHIYPTLIQAQLDRDDGQPVGMDEASLAAYDWAEALYAEGKGWDNINPDAEG